MLQSKLFYKTERNKISSTESISHDLLVRAGFIDQLMAGVYTFLPLGFRVLKKIENIIRQNMLEVDGQEMLMPALNPKENWDCTGRWNSLDILFKIKSTDYRDYALAPTHEEVVSPLAKKVILSYKDLPTAVFHIQNKFRNELRAKSGILRTREFMMKDLYSFHATQEDLDKYYEKVAKAYINIYKQCGIGEQTFRTLASGGSFSKYSDEFQTETLAGEDIVYVCKKCKTSINKEIKQENPTCPKCNQIDFIEKKAVEVGNIFKLGTKYSAPFNLNFKDKDGQEKLVLMGCYGIGLGRVLGTIVEINNDDKGIVWPKSVAPFDIHLICLGNSAKVRRVANQIYKNLSAYGRSLEGRQEFTVLYDDRDKTPGEKFAEADLIGIPLRIVVSERTLEKNSVEIKERKEKEAKLIKISQINKLIFK